MKYILPYILILFILIASCDSRQRVPSKMLQPDSLRVGYLFYKKAWKAPTLDSMMWYAELSCSYLHSKPLRAKINFEVATHCVNTGQPELALTYYRKSGEEADAWFQNRLCEVMPEVYVSMGRFDDAVHCLDSIRNSRRARSVIPYYCLAKGNLFAMIDQVDSACHYYTIAANSLNHWVAGTASHRLRLLYAAEGKDSLAYIMALNSDNVLKKEMQKEESAESRENFEKEKMRNELNRLKIDKQRREILALSLGLGAILIVFLFYFLLQRRKRQTNELLLNEKTIRLEQAQQLLEQADELTQLREKESQLRESLFRRMKSFHKIPSLEENDEEDVENDNHRIALSQEEWVDIRKTVDRSYDNFSHRLQQSFSSLSEKDINFCCLVKIGVSIKDLSDIYCISRTSVSRKKQRMKRDKLGLSAEGDTLDTFLRYF